MKMDLLFIVNHILKFILALYGNPNLPRKVVNIVIDYFHQFISEIYTCLKK